MPPLPLAVNGPRGRVRVGQASQRILQARAQVCELQKRRVRCRVALPKPSVQPQSVYAPRRMAAAGVGVDGGQGDAVCETELVALALLDKGFATRYQGQVGRTLWSSGTCKCVWCECV